MLSAKIVNNNLKAAVQMTENIGSRVVIALQVIRICKPLVTLPLETQCQKKNITSTEMETLPTKYCLLYLE